MPDPNEFLEKVKTLCPKACILDTKFVRQTHSEFIPDLQVKTTMGKHMCAGKLYVFSSSIFIHYHLCYLESEQQHVQVPRRFNGVYIVILFYHQSRLFKIQRERLLCFLTVCVY